MSALLNASRIGLLFFSAAASYAVWYIFMHNGSTDQLGHVLKVGPRTLPGTQEPIKAVYTGIPAIDKQLTILTLVFWEQVDGSSPSNSLFCFHFATQTACGWGVLMVESMRRGNRWRLISFLGFWGLLIQNAAYAFVLPIYLAIYLSTSPLVSSKSVSNLLVERHHVIAIFPALLLGFVLPSILMSLPAPSVLSFEQKQTYIAIWQLFPIWVSMVQAVLPYVMSKPVKTSSTKSFGSQGLHTMRILYVGLLVIAGFGQAATATLITTSTFFPDLFVSEFQGAFNLSKVFLPAAVSPSTKMLSIGSGTHLLLQYDELIGSGAMVLWSTTLFMIVYRKCRSHQSEASLIAHGIMAIFLTGPLGYVTACIWARDELLISQAEEDDKKIH